MKHLGLFEGIGGFSLAARWAGWETIAWCEWNEFGQRVLRHHFPEAEGHGDITKTDFTKYEGTIDIITGGFPCQPYSSAGKRKGKDDSRHLWPEMLRTIREVKPTWVVGENVLGLVNWNGGMVFDEVQADLENESYEVIPFILPACAVGAPHRRERVWFVAYSDKCAKRPSGKSGGAFGSGGKNNDEQKKRGEQAEQYNGFDNVLQTFTDSGLLGPEKCEKQTARIKQCDKGNDTNPDCDGCDKCNSNDEKHTSKGREYALNDINESDGNGNVTDTNCRRQSGKEYGETEPGRVTKESVSNYWENFPTQPPICGGDDGIST